MVARALAVAVVCITLARAAHAAPPSAEYRLKAVFLFNFANFVQWPAHAFASADAPLVICVLGDDPFGEALDETVAGESIDRRHLAVRRVMRGEPLEQCHLLFVSRSETQRLDEVFRGVGETTHVLTVSDIDRFASRGGTIGLFLDRNRVRFEISLNDARRRGLELSSQLLTLGRIVE